VLLLACAGSRAFYAFLRPDTCICGPACVCALAAGTLSSVLSTFMLLRLATLFLGGRALLYAAELYLGLAVFLGYVVYDTQVWVGGCWDAVGWGVWVGPMLVGEWRKAGNPNLKWIICC
jgi:hypothetical protein